MIDLHGQISVAFLKKRRFTGSWRGMRYLLQKAERTAAVPETAEEGGGQEKEPPVTETVLEAVIWPEPFNFEVTEEEKKRGKDFPLNGDGLEQAIAWLNEEYEKGEWR